MCENPTPTNDIDAFKKELIELCLKHGFEIGGCGCCGSPWINPATDPANFHEVPTVPWQREIIEKAADKIFEDKFGKEFKF